MFAALPFLITFTLASLTPSHVCYLAVHDGLTPCYALNSGRTDVAVLLIRCGDSGYGGYDSEDQGWLYGVYRIPCAWLVDRKECRQFLGYVRPVWKIGVEDVWLAGPWYIYPQNKWWLAAGEGEFDWHPQPEKWCWTIAKLKESSRAEDRAAVCGWTKDLRGAVAEVVKRMGGNGIIGHSEVRRASSETIETISRQSGKVTQ
jgi:hypothetical protein